MGYMWRMFCYDCGMYRFVETETEDTPPDACPDGHTNIGEVIRVPYKNGE